MASIQADDRVADGPLADKRIADAETVDLGTLDARSDDDRLAATGTALDRASSDKSTDKACSEDAGGKVRPRERIVETATSLFRKHGIRGIGVDAIAEAAGTNKMTLYRHFGSKDELVAECLRMQAKSGEAKWIAIESAHPGNPRAQLSAWIQLAADYIARTGQGCDLANTAIELHDDDHPARAVIEEFKKAQRDRLAAVCRAAGAADADLLADTLSLLVEGARVSRQSVGPEGPCSRFVRAAEATVEAAACRPCGERSGGQAQ